MSEPHPALRHGDTFAYSTVADLPTVRAFAHLRALRLGLDPERAGCLTLCVSELVTNTLQHTAGGGEVRIWADDGRLFCDVVDGGPMRVFGRVMPARDAVGGRGLPIVERLCDEVTAMAGDAGTIVRMAFAIGPHRFAG